jgi:hypothetical protein
MSIGTNKKITRSFTDTQKGSLFFFFFSIFHLKNIYFLGFINIYIIIYEIKSENGLHKGGKFHWQNGVFIKKKKKKIVKTKQKDKKDIDKKKKIKITTKKRKEIYIK